MRFRSDGDESKEEEDSLEVKMWYVFLFIDYVNLFSIVMWKILIPIVRKNSTLLVLTV